MRIKCDGIKTTLTGIGYDADHDLLKWAISNLSFVNGICYDIDGKEWISNIKATYDENTPQLKTVINLLESLK